MQKTDEELMLMYQSGDIQAFNELFSRYEGRLFSFLKSRLSHDEAEEVFQDVFRKVHEFRHRYDSSYAFAPWLFTLARNMLIDFYRKNKKVKFSEFDESYINEEEKEEVVEIDLSGLSKANQEILTMRYFEGKEFSQMARELQTTEVNVRKKISRAVLKLKEIWRK